MKGKHRASTCVLVSVAFLVVALATITSSSSCSSQTSESEWFTLNGNSSSSSMSELLNSNSSSSSSSHSSRDTGKKDGILHWEGSFLQQLLFFSPPLTGFESIWKVLVIWNLLGFALIYLVCGIVAGCVFKNHNLAIVIPLVSAIVGSVAGFFCGAILCKYHSNAFTYIYSCAFLNSNLRCSYLHIWTF